MRSSYTIRILARVLRNGTRLSPVLLSIYHIVLLKKTPLSPVVRGIYHILRFVFEPTRDLFQVDG